MGYKRCILGAGAVVAVALTALVGTSTAQATVPGEDGLIVFRADTGSGDNLYTVTPSAHHRVQITHYEGAGMDSPHWSPDGHAIAVGVGLPDTCSNVVTMRPDGSALTALPLANGDICEGSPSFSPDGTRIYYEGYDGTNDVVWSMRPDGSDRHLVTACQGTGVTAPDVSPDGRLLAMTCSSDTGQALFVSRLDGSHLTQLTPFDWNIGIKNDWSPDSSHLMFITQIGDTVNTDTIRSDGTGLTHITDFATGDTKAYGNTYSPDGRWIVMRIETAAGYAIYKVHPDGTGLRALTPFSAFRPRGMAWQSLPSDQ